MTALLGEELLVKKNQTQEGLVYKVSSRFIIHIMDL